MKALFTTLSLAALSSVAIAAPTEFSIPAGQLTRAEVQASAWEQGATIDHGEVTEFVVPQSRQTRAEVVADIEAERNMRTESDDRRMAGERRLYVGG